MMNPILGKWQKLTRSRRTELLGEHTPAATQGNQQLYTVNGMLIVVKTSTDGSFARLIESEEQFPIPRDRAKGVVNAGLKSGWPSDATPGVRRTQLNIAIDEDQRDQLDAYCAENSIERGVLVRQIIREFLTAKLAPQAMD